MTSIFFQSEARPDASPHVDVRVVLFTVRDGRLWVALLQEGDKSTLPTGVPVSGEALDAVAVRMVTEMYGAEERYIEQLYTIASGDADDWTVTVAYLGLALSIDLSRPPDAEITWADTRDLPSMRHPDRMIVDYAILRLRAKIGYTTIAFHLLPRSFSISELQLVYESILDRPLDKRNFRRRIQSEDILEPTAHSRRDGSHRPARLYRFRAAHDADAYLIPAWAAHLDGETTNS